MNENVANICEVASEFVDQECTEEEVGPEELDPELVQRGRKDEMDYMEKIKMFEYVD